jgi:hypothetical protein
LQRRQERRLLRHSALGLLAGHPRARQTADVQRIACNREAAVEGLQPPEPRSLPSLRNSSVSRVS